jgi:hypothetical protein
MLNAMLLKPLQVNKVATHSHTSTAKTNKHKTPTPTNETPPAFEALEVLVARLADVLLAAAEVVFGADVIVALPLRLPLTVPVPVTTLASLTVAVL